MVTDRDDKKPKHGRRNGERKRNNRGMVRSKVQRKKETKERPRTWNGQNASGERTAREGSRSGESGENTAKNGSSERAR